MFPASLARSLAFATLLVAPAPAAEFYGLDGQAAGLYRMDTSTSAAFSLGTITGVPNSGLGALTSGPQGTIYGLASGLVNGYSVYAIDSATLQATLLFGPIGLTTGDVGLCYDAQRRSLWVAGFVQRSLRIRLEEVDLSSGVAAHIGYLTGNMWGLALDQQGNLYSTAQGSSSADLVRLDKTNAAMTVLGSLGNLDLSQGLALSSDRGSGSLHLLERSQDSVYRVDAVTGAAALVSVMSGAASIRSFDEIPCPALQSYGSGCPGTGGFAPVLGLTGCPARGASITVELTRAYGGSFAALLFGTSQIAIPIGGGCDLLVTPILPVQVNLALSGSGPGNGTATLPATFPTFLPAGTFTMQAVCIDLLFATQITTSNGVQITI